MYTKEKELSSDFALFIGIISSLIVIGLIFIYSASSVFAFEKFGSAHFFVKKQIFGLLLGMVGMFFFAIVPLRLIKKMTFLLFLSSFLLTTLTLLPHFGLKIHGSTRWVSLSGFSFQPSELLKFFFILYLASFLSKKNRPFSSFLYGYFPFLILTGATAALLLTQPDFGMAITITITAFLLLFIVHFSFKQLISTVLVIIPLFFTLIYAYPYRLRRITTFLNPWRDPRGAGFQIIQSLIAIGSGSFWGVGIAHSKQKFFYLPMLHTDFIFSIIAEETGFFGASLLIFVYCVFLYCCTRLAWRLRDQWSFLVTTGFIIIFNLQTIINLAVTTSLFPTKGIGLPFISYGNSSLITNLCFVGVIINCIQHDRKIRDGFTW